MMLMPRLAASTATADWPSVGTRMSTRSGLASSSVAATLVKVCATPCFADISSATAGLISQMAQRSKWSVSFATVSIQPRARAPGPDPAPITAIRSFFISCSPYRSASCLLQQLNADPRQNQEHGTLDSVHYASLPNILQMSESCLPGWDERAWKPRDVHALHTCHSERSAAK